MLNMKWNKRTILAIVLTLILVVSACSKPQETTVEKAADPVPENQVSEATEPEESVPADPNVNKTGYPIVKEKITLKMTAPYWDGYGYLDYKDMDLFKRLEEKTNIHIEWQTIPRQAWQDKVGIMLSSNDLPDVFFGTSAGNVGGERVVTYSAEGMFIRLNELIDDYMPNLRNAMQKRPELQRLMKYTDGGIYAFPLYVEDPYAMIPSKYYINTSWLDKLGLTMPETVEEFEHVLKQFKEGDPNGNGQPDEIPFSFLPNPNKGPYALLGAFGYVVDQNYLVNFDGNGKASVPQMSEEYRKGIQWLSKLYSENLIDKEAFTHTNAQYIGKGKVEPTILGVYSDMSGLTQVGLEKFQKEYALLPPLKGPDGFRQLTARGPNFYRTHLVITNKNEYPEATARWIDEFFDENLMLEFQEGPIGIVLNDNGDGTYSKNDPPQDVSPSDFLYGNSPVQTVGFITSDTLLKITPDVPKQIAKAENDFLEPYLVRGDNGFVVIPSDQSDRMSQIELDMTTYVNTTFAEWVTGISNIEADWDNYLNEMNKMGADDYLRMKQEGYDKTK